MVLGNGEKALFWKDRWLNGLRLVDIAPNLVGLVPPWRANMRTVKDGLSGEWLRDCGPDLGEAGVPELFRLWLALADALLTPGVEDVLVWSWTESGVFSVKSAYAAFFAGITAAPVSAEI